MESPGSSSTTRSRTVPSLQNYSEDSNVASAQQDGGFVASFLDMMARAPLPLQYALGSTITCSVLLKLEVEDLLDRNKDKTDGLMGKLLNKMAVVKKSGKQGLVHWVDR